MLTDCAEDASIAMCENVSASFSLNSCLDEKDWTVEYMKLDCFTILVCLNCSLSFSNDDFSSFDNSTKEERLLRN